MKTYNIAIVGVGNIGYRHLEGLLKTRYTLNIFLFDINYKRLLHSTWSFAQKLSGVECMCCSTILCHWHPQLTMKHITEEIKQNFNLKIRMMEIAHCKKIVDKYFGHYIPIEEFL